MPPVAIQTRRWTRQEYERMAELGLFRPEERVQLLDGEIVITTPQNSPHAAAIGKTERVLAWLACLATPIGSASRCRSFLIPTRNQNLTLPSYQAHL